MGFLSDLWGSGEREHVGSSARDIGDTDRLDVDLEAGEAVKAEVAGSKRMVIPFTTPFLWRRWNRLMIVSTLMPYSLAMSEVCSGVLLKVAQYTYVGIVELQRCTNRRLDAGA